VWVAKALTFASAVARSQSGVVAVAQVRSAPAASDLSLWLAAAE